VRLADVEQLVKEIQSKRKVDVTPVFDVSPEGLVRWKNVVQALRSVGVRCEESWKGAYVPLLEVGGVNMMCIRLA
jgi:DNA primase